MNLNNGRFEVETEDSQRLDESEWQNSGDGYSYETEKKFTLWKTRGGNYFVTMQYVEYIAAGILNWWRDKGTRKCAEGNQLVDVYKSNTEAHKACIRYRIPVPAQFIEKVA